MNKKIRFGENLKILRSRNGLSQEQVAERLHVTRQTISTWELNFGKPDIYMLGCISEMFEISTDLLLWGKLDESILKNINVCSQIDYKEDFISSIRKKGFYDINNLDLEEFFPVISFEFSRIMGIVLELKERKYNVVSVYGNGFGIYFNSDNIAEKFADDLYEVIECFVHYETEKRGIIYSEFIQSKISEIEIEILNEVYKEVYGTEMNEMFYWIDELDRIRGYGKTEKECSEQAKQQGCVEFNIFHS